jgi:sulfite reductase alpha subunit-like flavoprotein
MTSFLILVAVTVILALVIRYLFSKPLVVENKQPQTNPDISTKSNLPSAVIEKTTIEVEDEDTVCVVYGSQKGTAKGYATQLVNDFKEQGIKVDY